MSFTTYNSSVLKKVRAGNEKVEIRIESRQYLLEVTAERDAPTALVSPVRGAMEGRIEESMSSRVVVDLIARKDEKSIFHGNGRNAAVEVAGNVDRILIG
jgi:hypothetical protein